MGINTGNVIKEKNMNDEPRLCGGTFFVLIRQACDRGKDTSCLRDLLKIYRPGYSIDNEATFVRYTSEFKNCKAITRNALKLRNDHFIRDFDSRVRTSYNKPLSKMSLFVDNYISTQKLN